MRDIKLQHYYNRYSSDKFWDEMLFRSGHFIHAAEFNEMQSIFKAKLKAIGDAVFSDGDRLAGCEIAVDKAAETVRLGAGLVYLDGEVRAIEGAVLCIPMNDAVKAGVYIRHKVVTEVEDGTLRDPSVGCPGHNHPGAGRLVATAHWGLSTDNLSDDIFHPIYDLSAGDVITPAIESKSYLSEFMEHLARYDRETHGFFLINGLVVSAQEAEPGKQAFSISEGKAHVRGYEVEFPYSLRLVVDESADTLDALSEPHAFTPDANKKMRINVNHSPIHQIRTLRATLEKTSNVQHGNYSGCSDPLPHTSVAEIVKVQQGAKVYVQGADYRRTADAVDWSPSGDEVAPGSTYQVTYRYIAEVMPEAQDPKGFTLTNAVTGSIVLVDYSYRLPRKDIIVINQQREAKQIKGVPHRFAPAYPVCPPDCMLLAKVDQDWHGLPIVHNVATRTVPMDELQWLKRTVIRLQDSMALEGLKTDAIISAPTSTHGIFVDAFHDDDLRDAGIPQTASIFGGSLSLPLAVDVRQFGSTGATLLDHNREMVLEQLYRTGSMKINPYQAFEPLPAKVSLNPSVDRWNLPASAALWASAITRQINIGSGNMTSRSTSSSVENLGNITTEDAIMRVRDVEVHAEGFGPGEFVDAVTFDGIPVSLGVTNADSEGNINASFRIPAGITVGVKLFQITGRHTTARATYTGTGTITTQIVRNVTTITTSSWWSAPVDPLAQTFTLQQSRHIDSIDVYFTRKGSSVVRLQLRTVSLGFPTSIVLAETELKQSQILNAGVNRFTFDRPVYLSAGTEYAFVVLTDTDDHELGIARLGEYDVVNNWVRAQPFQAGVLLSSSNASTWSDHQDADLWFRINGAVFSGGKKRIRLGEIQTEKMTDVLPLAEVEYTSANTDVTFIITNKASGKEIVRVQPGQFLSMSEAFTGTVIVDAELVGDRNLSPVLHDGVQLVLGSLGLTGDYVSRAFPCGADQHIQIRLDALLPGSSSIRVFVQTGSSTQSPSAWTEATFEHYDELGDGLRRRTYSAICNLPETRVKIVLSGTPAERPHVRALRAVVFNA